MMGSVISIRFIFGKKKLGTVRYNLA